MTHETQYLNNSVLQLHTILPWTSVPGFYNKTQHTWPSINAVWIPVLRVTDNAEHIKFMVYGSIGLSSHCNTDWNRKFGRWVW